MSGLVVIWLICAIVGGLVGQNKKMGSTSGFLLGGLLGLIGLAIVVLSAQKEGAS